MDGDQQNQMADQLRRLHHRTDSEFTVSDISSAEKTNLKALLNQLLRGLERPSTLVGDLSKTCLLFITNFNQVPGVLEAGYYTPMSSASIICSHPFTPIDQVLCVLNLCRNLCIVERVDSNLANSLFSSLYRVVPVVSPFKRFPVVGQFVDIFSEPLVTALSSLVAHLCYARGASEDREVVLKYQKELGELILLISSPSSAVVYSRETFEERFSLVWKTL
ncbi:24.5 kDa movement protein [Rubber tree latent virus 1]|nr:24.5 kDa movement protein [Rubber tree latent virus 1]WNV36292.1 hypothetical protein [Rubber tree latent virus 1]